jgi:hypothetical protein
LHGVEKNLTHNENPTALRKRVGHLSFDSLALRP